MKRNYNNSDRVVVVARESYRVAPHTSSAASASASSRSSSSMKLKVVVAAVLACVAWFVLWECPPHWDTAELALASGFEAHPHMIITGKQIYSFLRSCVQH